MKKASKNFPIDAVITWVDGNDPIWKKSKEYYVNQYTNPESTHSARFRSWDNLDIVVDSIKKNLPWVRKIFIVTASQTPHWYNPKDRRVRLVFHEEFIPKKYLPTFNSHTIELNLHRIKNLSEHFIYFNDDTFAIGPMKKTDFFKDGLPCDFGIMSIHCQKKSLMIYDICNNDVAILNEHFDIKNINKHKWLNLKYGFRYNLQNLFLFQCPRFPGFLNAHLPQPFLKTTYKTVWKAEPEVLDATCMHKFRTRDDVNQWLLKSWQLCSGNFTPTKLKRRGALIDFEKNATESEIKKCINIINNQKCKLICINDGDTVTHYDHIKKTVNRMLRKRLADA